MKGTRSLLVAEDEDERHAGARTVYDELGNGTLCRLHDCDGCSDMRECPYGEQNSTVRFLKRIDPWKLTVPSERTLSGWRLTRARVIERDGRGCAICGSEERPEVDHIIPVSRGGTDAEDNLRVLCKRHNVEKSWMTADEYDEWLAAGKPPRNMPGNVNR